MGELLTAIAVFIFSHIIPMRPRLRQSFERRLGSLGFLIAYSLLSLLIIYWLATAFLSAPYILLWPWTAWAAWLPVVVMPIACMLLVAGISSPNPFSLGRGAKGYCPESPGIVSVTRHPVMWALVVWAGAHIPVNGDLAAVLLFGLMLLLSLAGTISIERNRRHRYSASQWQAMRAGTCNLPFAGGLNVDWGGIGIARIVGGLLLYLVLLLGHQSVVGIAPPLVRLG